MEAGKADRFTEKRAHEVTRFDVLVRAPFAETALLFGPEGERAWAGEQWNPRFVYPQPGSDEQGAVFTVQYGPLEAVWVIARLDMVGRHFQYVYVIPAILVCVIDVEFTPVDGAMTKVHVTYARTAISAAGNEQVAMMAEGDRRAGAEWQEALDNYIARAHGGA